MHPHIENMNYARDPRTQGLAETPTICIENECETCPGAGCPDCHGQGLYYEDRELPCKWVACPVCDGKGTHVNPSIDCCGITAEDFDEDPDFREDYMAGVYEQTCNRCNGRTTIQDVDEERCTPDQLEAWSAKLQDEADERRNAAMGY